MEKSISTKNKIIKIAVVIGIIAIAIAVYFIFSPAESDLFPQCPFHYLTGLDCPGCGSQRALHSLLHFHLGEAFLYNPLMIVSIPYVAIGIYFEYLEGKMKFPKMRTILFGKTATIVVFFIVVLYWIGRNVVKFI